ncbi:hypothetical protein ABH922_005753 [Rhodococcus sp. 27YEA15]
MSTFTTADGSIRIEQKSVTITFDETAPIEKRQESPRTLPFSALRVRVS